MVSWIQSWFPTLPTMCSMHLFQPASSVRISWYPTLVGSYWVSHKVLRNPNSSRAISRWTNLPYSTSSILIIPKLMKIIMNKVWFRNVTIWTIFTHVTLLTAFIANATFVLVGHTIPCNFFSTLASKSCSWRRWLPCLVCLKWTCPGQHLWRPRFLITVINANDRISRVKPAGHRSNLGQPGSWPRKPRQWTLLNPLTKSTRTRGQPLVKGTVKPRLTVDVGECRPELLSCSPKFT
jgi:hypothetical protein